MSVPNSFTAVTSATGAQLDANFAACAQLNAANTLSGQLNHAPSVPLASAGTVNIGAAASNNITISGNVTITAFDTIAEGALRILTFTGSPVITYNGASMQLIGGTSRQVIAGDVSLFRSLGSGNWKEEFTSGVFGSNGSRGYTLRPEQATTSGSSVNFNSIPAWVRTIHIMLVGVSTTGTAATLIQIGPVGGVENSGYLGSVVKTTDSLTPSGLMFSTGFALEPASVASYVRHGRITLTLENASTNTWAYSAVIGRSDVASVSNGGGIKALAGALTQLTLSCGADTFDAGAVNVAFE